MLIILNKSCLHIDIDGAIPKDIEFLLNYSGFSRVME